VLTSVCLQLDLRALVCIAETCKRFRHGDGGLETAELPTKSPVVTALREHAFPGGGQVPSTLPIGCSESCVGYLARCVRQRRCREAPSIAAGLQNSLFLDGAGRLLACSSGGAAGHGDAEGNAFLPDPVVAMAGIQVQSVAAEGGHSLVLGWDGRVYSWGKNEYGQLGQRDKLDRPSPTLVEGLEDVRDIAVAYACSLAATQSGVVFAWGRAILLGSADAPRPIIVEGFGGVRVRQACIGAGTAFAIGQAGELFSWGRGENMLLGHGDTQDQPSPKRVEAVQGVRMSSVSVGVWHALALTEDGLVYAWGENRYRALLGNPHVERELLPKPVEALRGVRVGSIAAGGVRSYAVADTGELWAWGVEYPGISALGHGGKMNVLCPSRSSGCGASRWMRWLPAAFTRWR
jgi:alpha-tubulin suppressor-like RCC1 family protein